MIEKNTEIVQKINNNGVIPENDLVENRDIIMAKRTVVVSAPATSRSGYGDHARDLIRSFISIKEYEVIILGPTF